VEESCRGLLGVVFANYSEGLTKNLNHGNGVSKLGFEPKISGTRNRIANYYTAMLRVSIDITYRTEI
jgi:hypothetical protein